ncbi:hypothetical protein CHS0354_040465 [Potamilus streckersoni]|uniref:Uncharacterized protein n=1 Tax=Potamilus streckersoni TaxID=2493646 RepID=A0AAE0T102_9BIVA|nr:hypothetical protein CHS0354_040465 [Potamilus streckersoni]
MENHPIANDVINQNDKMEEVELDEITIVCGVDPEIHITNESSSENEINLLSVQKTNIDDPPLYGIPPSPELFGSNFSQSEHTLALNSNICKYFVASDLNEQTNVLERRAMWDVNDISKGTR